MSRFSNLEFNNDSEEHFSQAAPAKDGPYYLELAHIAFAAGRFEEALRGYAKVLEFDPACAPAWAGQVRMLIELGESAEANLWADKALERFPNDPEILAGKAVALARLGDLKAALSFSDAAVEAQGDIPYVWLARGDVLLARMEKRAEFCFDRALSLATRDWMIPWLVSRILWFYRKFSRALQQAQKAVEMDPGRAVAWLQFGRCQLALGLAQGAGQSFEHARGLDPLCQPDVEERRGLSETGWCDRLFGFIRQKFGS